jgi:hypothetical protein
VSTKPAAKGGVDDRASPSQAVQGIFRPARIRRLLGIVQGLDGFSRLVFQGSKICLAAHVPRHAW